MTLHDAITIRKTEAESLLQDIARAIEATPADAHWGHAGTLSKVVTDLREIAELLGVR